MIQSQFQAILARSGQTSCRLPILVEMTYDETDPLAFAMTFTAAGEASHLWKASRDLLVEAMACTTLTGQGDVRLRRDPLSGHLLVCIESPNGQADIKFPLQRVEEFLEMSEDEAADAVSILPDLVDDAIRGILGGR